MSRRPVVVLTTLLLVSLPVRAQSAAADAQRLVAAVLADTPLVEDLRFLTDEIGGRPTGSEANHRSVEWAVDRFRAAGVAVRTEPFATAARWEERSIRAEVGGAAGFAPSLVAKPFSTGTSPEGLRAPVVDGGLGSTEDFARLGDTVRGAWVLIDTPELLDLDGLFGEYAVQADIERRAAGLGVAGLVYRGSRPSNDLYRHFAYRTSKNDLVAVIVDRDAGDRMLRLLRAGRALEMTLWLDVEQGPGFTAHNVVGEIPGSDLAREVVVIGAHLDSWGLGTGALDNGCNVALVIDVARQMQRLGLQPRRTIRFVLFNGEEQGLEGSLGYVRTHAETLDHHVMASSFDIGSGRITGFFVNGPPALASVVERALAPVAGLGPFTSIDHPIVGTDNFDFMLEGVPNLVANQESANYGPHYHARSDTFDKVNLEQVRLNAAIASAVAWGFANLDFDLPRQSRAWVESLIESTDLGDQMEMFDHMEAWMKGERGRVD